VVKPELIIFDMDGLMFDTERIAFISWKKAALNHGYEVNEDIFKQTIGANLERTKEIYLTYFGNEFPIEEVAYQRFIIAENLIKTNGVPVKTGLYDVLNFLKDLNIKKAVATPGVQQP
jgi:beta-phosphoglucomutase-like phosphatase (HAD superfamily)